MPYLTGLPLASIAIMVLLHCSWFQNRFSPNNKKSSDAKCACPECWFQTLHKQGVQSWQRMWASGSKTFCHTLDKLIMLITVHIVSIILIYIHSTPQTISKHNSSTWGSRYCSNVDVFDLFLGYSTPVRLRSVFWPCEAAGFQPFQASQSQLTSFISAIMRL